ncbi:ROK family protein [Hyalangium rubrum]|uniref:ROK family protein n=1 Tax=Hyalangium rubrum TaxID=3103134 RepID=A0ABU5HHX3_9BACT|nr:ROK family protein [Hyalangium sp. s54d21]MDY7232469.1 ROK family protein [Hyalangium sp. s54d21]
MSVSGWDVQRYRPTGVTPLEVWNLPVSGHELWELLGTPRMESDRRHGMSEELVVARQCLTLIEALQLLLSEHRVDAVYLTGGIAALEGITSAREVLANSLPCPVYIAQGPRFASVRAGLQLLEDLRPTSPLCVDVGQTSIKCASRTRLHVFERDTTVLPRLFIGMPRPADGHHVTSAVRFIAGALHTTALGLVPPVDAICLALPSPVDDALVPGGCTYGWEEHASLVMDILDAAKLTAPRCTVRVLNDAELAAEAARNDSRVTGQRVLCLTLGFGPGGALLERGG